MNDTPHRRATVRTKDIHLSMGREAAQDAIEKLGGKVCWSAGGTGGMHFSHPTWKLGIKLVRSDNGVSPILVNALRKLVKEKS